MKDVVFVVLRHEYNGPVLFNFAYQTRNLAVLAINNDIKELEVLYTPCEYSIHELEVKD